MALMKSFTSIVSYFSDFSRRVFRGLSMEGITKYARRGSVMHKCKALVDVRAGAVFLCKVVCLSDWPVKLNSYLAMRSLRSINIFPKPCFQFPLPIHNRSMSTKAVAMHLLAIGIFHRFEPSFLLAVSTFLKNGNKAISGRKRQHASTHERNNKITGNKVWRFYLVFTWFFLQYGTAYCGV